MERHRADPALGALARREVYRGPALASDLVELCGAEWADLLPLTAAGRDYATRVTAAAKGSGDRLIGHAYVRYFGDLNGGQILKRRLETSIDLPPGSLSFYDFPNIDDMQAFLRSYREALDRSALSGLDHDLTVESAIEAFSLNIRLSQAVQRLVLDDTADPA